MAPAKTKKKPLADLSAKKRFDKGKKKINPFEVHINRDKQKVIGRQLKADRGLPGVARSKALNIRKNTILQAYMVKDKDNVFKDNRIGEKDSTLSFEEKANARYAAELRKAHKKKNIYSLDGGEILTHRGQTLEEIEKFEDPRSDDDDYDDDNGQMDKKFVGAHFGGGLFSQTNGHKDVLAELILQSKKQKAEQQKTREDNIKKTEELDSTWKDLQALVVNSSKNLPEQKNEEIIKSDDYDIAVRSLKFESRGQATDRLKTDEEIDKEEKDKLEKFELDRLARMNGFLNFEDSKSNHKSGDHLDDGFDIEDIEEEEEEGGILAYDEDGVMLGIKKNNEDNIITESDDVKQNEENENVESDDEDADEDEEEEEEENDDEANEEEEKSDDDDDDDNSNAEESDDNLSDLKESDSSSDDEEEIKEETLIKKKSSTPKEEKIELKKQDEANKKSNEPIEKLTNTFEYHVKDIIDVSDVKSTEDVIKLFQKLDKICPQLYDLAQVNPQSTWTTIQTIMKEKHEEFEINKKIYPGLDTLILFKIISLLFPTSDFRHPVVTPCIIFMSQILLRCRVKSKLDISKGLFISALMLEFTVLSKRFSPAVINFLRVIIYLSTVKPPPLMLKSIPPLKKNCEFSSSLVLEKSSTGLDIKPIGAHMQAKDLIQGEIDDDFRIRSYLTSINILNDFKNQLNELDAVYLIFEPIVNLMRINNYKKYPKQIRQHVKKIIDELAALKDKELQYLVRDKKKPKALRLYEPRIETIYDGKRHKSMSKEKAQHEKLVYQVKKEQKSVIRKLRKDASFLAKVQIQEKIKSDNERKRKVKEIYGEGAAQQGELNSLKRMK